MLVPLWVGRYLKIPYKRYGMDRAGLSDWGLVRLIMQEQFGRALPSYISTNAAGIQKALQGGRTYKAIHPSDFELGDILSFDAGRKDQFTFGLCLAPGLMLYCAQHKEVCTIRYLEHYWSERLVGGYRYAPYYEDDLDD